MKRHIITVALIIGVLLFSTFAASSSALIKENSIKESQINRQAQQDYVPGQVAVLIKENRLGDSQIENILRQSSPVKINSIEKLHKYDLDPSLYNHGKRIFILIFDERINPYFAAESLKSNPLVLIAEPNFIAIGNMVPNDIFFPAQWGLQRIMAPEAFDLELGDSEVIIAVIDTGIDLDHEDLIVKALPGWDAVDHDFIPEDDNGHGTISSGIAIATTNNVLGIAGTCPLCMLLPVRAGYDNNGQAYFSLVDILQAMEFAVNNPRNLEGVPANPNIANVISMSFGSANPSTFLWWGVEDAYNAGAVLVAAAGNYNNSIPRYPAAYEEVIAVAATDENDAKASFSNYGSWVDVAAPGVSIQSTFLGNGYAGMSGTSASTPFVAGVAGLILSFNNQLTQEEVREILINTSDPVYGFPQIIGGRVNAYEALLATPAPNSAPVLFPMGPRYVRVGYDVIITASAIDADNDTISFSINDDRFNYIELPPDGEVQQGQFIWHTGYNDAGTYTFEVTASDFNSNDMENVTVVVYRDSGGKELYTMYGEEGV